MIRRWFSLGDAPGRAIVATAWVSLVIVVVALVPFALGVDALESTVVVVSLASFFVGFGLWIVAFFAALARTTRGDDIAVSSWVFLAGSAPVAVRNNFMTVAALTVALSIVTTNATPFVWLTNLLPLALAAWWGARHGTFPARMDRPGGVARGRPGK